MRHRGLEVGATTPCTVGCRGCSGGGRRRDRTTSSRSVWAGEPTSTWSPTGNQILFVARPTPASRRALWVVNADGSGLRQLSIPDRGGLIGAPASRSVGCDTPSWSPDGTKIAFSRLSAKTHVKNIYTVNSDGTDLFR